MLNIEPLKRSNSSKQFLQISSNSSQQKL